MKRLAPVCAVLAVMAGCGGSRPSADTAPAMELSFGEQMERLAPPERLTALRAMRAERPADATLPFHMGNAYYELGAALPTDRHDQAVAYFDTAVTMYRDAVDLDSTYSRAYVNMALAQEAAGNRADARGTLLSAIHVNPADVLAYCHLGQIEHAFGNTAEAIRLYRSALAIDPNSAQAHYNLGLAFADAKIFAEALREWETVTRLDPDGELGKSAADNVRLIRQYLEAKP